MLLQAYKPGCSAFVTDGQYQLWLQCSAGSAQAVVTKSQESIEAQEECGA